MHGRIRYSLLCAAAAAATVPALPALPATAEAPADCAAIRVVTIRGTLEPQSGSLLLTPVARRIAQESPRHTVVTELDYPASMAPDSSVRGAEALTTLLDTTAGTCPDQQLVLLGYSQGARVIANTLTDPAVAERAAARIDAIALFGNPRFNGAEPYNRGTFDPTLSGVAALPLGALTDFGDRLRDYCNAGDRVCQGGDPAAGFGNALSWGHFAYFVNGNRDQAAAFVHEQLES